MHFLIDANLPRSLGDRIRLLGHSVTDVRGIGLGDADDEVVAALARGQGMVLLTRDFDFSDVRNYPPAQYAGTTVVAGWPRFSRIGRVAQVQSYRTWGHDSPFILRAA